MRDKNNPGYPIEDVRPHMQWIYVSDRGEAIAYTAQNSRHFPTYHRIIQPTVSLWRRNSRDALAMLRGMLGSLRKVVVCWASVWKYLFMLVTCLRKCVQTKTILHSIHRYILSCWTCLTHKFNYSVWHNVPFRTFTVHHPRQLVFCERVMPSGQHLPHLVKRSWHRCVEGITKCACNLGITATLAGRNVPWSFTITTWSLGCVLSPCRFCILVDIVIQSC